MSYPSFVILCSTTGDGDPPDNASKFFRFPPPPIATAVQCYYTLQLPCTPSTLSRVISDLSVCS